MKGDHEALMVTVVTGERDEMVVGTGADGKGDMGEGRRREGWCGESERNLCGWWLVT